MSTFASSRFATVCAALGLLLVAGSARAQFEECVFPLDVPVSVFNTILDQASFDFGEVSEKACTGIVKEGVKACKAQVKAADKCYDRAFDMNYSIGVKQCQELDESGDRADCKAGFKTIRDGDKAEFEVIKESGLVTCEGDFASELSEECLGIVVK